jgi:hypothetical protein
MSTLFVINIIHNNQYDAQSEFFSALLPPPLPRNPKTLIQRALAHWDDINTIVF